MADKYLLMKESEELYGDLERCGYFSSADEAEKEAEKLFDKGFLGDFIIKECKDKGTGYETGFCYSLSPTELSLHTCPICDKQVRVHKMQRTYDCHGIPFRMVCEKCYDRIMNTKGYDGERYSELDECLDYDY